MRLSYRDWATLETVTSVRFLKYWLVLFTTLALFACSELSEYDQSQVKTTLNDSLLTTTESWDVQMGMMREGKTRLLIEGSYAISYRSEEKKHTEIEGPVYVQLFDTLGNLETEAWSKRATYFETDAVFELIDSVKVQTVDDRFLYTEFLKYVQDTDQISSPHLVTIITPSDSISGHGFTGQTDLSSYTITQPRGRLIVD